MLPVPLAVLGLAALVALAAVAVLVGAATPVVLVLL